MTWEIGNLAVCVGSDDDCSVCGAPDSLDAETQLADDGDILTVTAIDPPEPALGVPTYGLAFDGGCEFSCSCAFRKVIHDKAEQCEPEFVTLLKRIKQPETASEWLERVGPIAKRLNFESKFDVRQTRKEGKQ